MQACLECGLKFMRLSKHVTVSHNIKYEEYIIKHVYSGVRPKCACGCEAPVAFSKGKFKNFIRSHASRVDKIRKVMIDGGLSAAHDESKRKKISDALIIKWQDPEYRKSIHTLDNTIKRLEALRKVTSTKEFSDKLRCIKKALWQDAAWSDKQRAIFKSKAYKDIVSSATKIALADETIRQTLSHHAKLAYATGKRKPKSNWSSIKSGWRFNPCIDSHTWFDSMWEYEFLIACHDAGLRCIREPFIISYEHEGKASSYFPDFLVEDVIVEIKGRKVSLDDIKYTAAVKFANERGLKFVVLNKKQFNDFISAKKNEKH